MERGLTFILFILISLTSWNQTQFNELRPKIIENQTYYFKDSNLFTGISVQFYADKTLRIEEHFKNGQRHGISKRWSPEGVLVFEYLFQDGKKTGTEKRWNLEGKLIYNAQLINETGFLYCDCREEQGNDACEYDGDVVWAKYKNGIKTGKWNQEKEGKTYTIQHFSFGFEGWIQRYEIKDETGKVIESTIEKSDYLYDKYKAINSQFILYGAENDLFYKRQSHSKVNPIHQKAHPEAHYFDGSQKPITCVVLDLYPDLSIKMKAIIKDGVLTKVYYFNKNGQEITGLQSPISGDE